MKKNNKTLSLQDLTLHQQYSIIKLLGELEASSSISGNIPRPFTSIKIIVMLPSSIKSNRKENVLNKLFRARG